MPDAAAGRVHSREGAVMTTLARILTRREEIRGGHLCGASPSGGGFSWLACVRAAGHAEGKPAERHEAGGLWRGERQQAPVQDGHVHSTELPCTAVRPQYVHG
jgi:hypothetical protein